MICLARFVAAATLLLLRCIGNPALAQTYLAPGYSGKLPLTSSVDQMMDALQLGKPAQRQDLLERLGVNSDIAHNAAQSVSVTGIRIDKLEGSHTGLLFLPCRGPGTPMAHLFLLLPGKKQAWHVADEMSLDCWFQDATYELPLVPGQSTSILVHHANEGHGSGYVQDDILLLGVRGGHLVTLLKTQEYKSEDLMGEGKTVEEKSTLQPFPDGSLEETCAKILHETISAAAPDRVRLVAVERRRWLWNQEGHSFTATEFRAVEP